MALAKQRNTKNLMSLQTYWSQISSPDIPVRDSDHSSSEFRHPSQEFRPFQPTRQHFTILPRRPERIFYFFFTPILCFSSIPRVLPPQRSAALCRSVAWWLLLITGSRPSGQDWKKKRKKNQKVRLTLCPFAIFHFHVRICMICFPIRSSVWPD